MRPVIYLAGPISGLTFAEGISWRDYVQQQLPHWCRTASPLRNKDYLHSIGTIEPVAYNIHPLSTARGIMTRDRYDCSKAQLVLMNLLGATRISVGTMIEAGWCDSHRTPLVLCMEENGNIHDHPMLREAAGYVVPTLDEGINLALSILEPYGH